MRQIVFFAVILPLFISCGKTVKIEPVVLPRDVWRGVCLAHSWERGGTLGYGSEASFESLTHLKRQGVNYVSITPFGFMDSLLSYSVQGAHNFPHMFSETDKRVTDVVAQAKQLGMRVMLKPHIWVNHGKWRGNIVPKDREGNTVWNKWWESYKLWIMHYAALAEKLETDSFVIGVELESAIHNHPEKLIELAGEVRSLYNGQITYSANWNEPVPQKAWELLDFVSVQFYPPLAEKGQKQTDKMFRKKLNENLDYWVEVARKTSKPLVATEFGYRSAEGAAIYPYAWPERNPEEMPDNALQARLYRIFFEEFSKRDEIRGLFLWKYFTNKDTDEEGPNGFSPRGKPAEGVARGFYYVEEEAAE